jgi:hypothetical protein
MFPKPVSVKAKNPYLLDVKYSDGTEGLCDVSYLLNKPVFKSWDDPEFFSHVYIDLETSAIAWSEEIELCPDSIYVKIKGLTFEQWRSNQDSNATSK